MILAVVYFTIQEEYYKLCTLLVNSSILLIIKSLIERFIIVILVLYWATDTTCPLVNGEEICNADSVQCSIQKVGLWSLSWHTHSCSNSHFPCSFWLAGYALQEFGADFCRQDAVFDIQQPRQLYCMQNHYDKSGLE